jgi:hypothetical protein
MVVPSSQSATVLQQQSGGRDPHNKHLPRPTTDTPDVQVEAFAGKNGDYIKDILHVGGRFVSRCSFTIPVYDANLEQPATSQLKLLNPRAAAEVFAQPKRRGHLPQRK